MKAHRFTITATGLDPRDDAFRTELHAAGCEDAEITFWNGRIVLHFDREAVSLDVALISAIWDVQRSGATVESVAARLCEGSDELVPLAAEKFDALTKAINASSLDASRITASHEVMVDCNCSPPSSELGRSPPIHSIALLRLYP